MPKHIRHRLISDLRKACDSLYEFTEFEETTHEEKQELLGIKESLDEIRVKIWDIGSAIEERTPKFQNIPKAAGIQNVFSWEKHDSTVAKTKLESKIEDLKKQLENL